MPSASSVLEYLHLVLQARMSSFGLGGLEQGAQYSMGGHPSYDMYKGGL